MYCDQTLRSGTITSPTDRDWPTDEHALQSASNLPKLRVGSWFGNRRRYQLLSRIAVGGTSVVHAVNDHELGRIIAGKFMAVERDAQFASALHMEAHATARLCHPNIVTVHDVGVWDGVHFQLMERLEGDSLAGLLSAGPLRPRDALRVVAVVADALEYAHRQSILHLDLKPGNVHIGNCGVVKLIDFGVGSARLVRGQRGAARTTIVGTPAYMAPEQWNSGCLDARTDVWSLGILLYECLTGKLPFDIRHSGLPYGAASTPSIPRLSPELGLPGVVDQAIQRALRKEPVERFQNVSQFVAVLRMVAQSLVVKTVANFTRDEVSLAGCASALPRGLTVSHAARMSGLSNERVSQVLSRLTDLGILKQRRGERGVSYDLLDQCSARACLDRLPAIEQGMMLNRLLR